MICDPTTFKQWASGICSIGSEGLLALCSASIEANDGQYSSPDPLLVLDYWSWPRSKITNSPKKSLKAAVGTTLVQLAKISDNPLVTVMTRD